MGMFALGEIRNKFNQKQISRDEYFRWFIPTANLIHQVATIHFLDRGNISGLLHVTPTASSFISLHSIACWAERIDTCPQGAVEMIWKFHS